MIAHLLPGQTMPQQANSRRVLVVDDNRDSAQTLAMMLRLMGHQTTTAHDGPEAIEVAKEFQPEIILLDIGLPKMNGYEVCRRIRALDFGRSALIVALTGWGQDDDRRQSSDAGFDRHLVKPIDFTVLGELLSRPRLTAHTAAS
jgi:CheY-like chemotaxis protein